MSDTKFLVTSTENYLTDYEYDSPIDYLFKYIELIHQYLNYSKEHMFIQDLKMNKYVIIKGLELLDTTFNILLLYTKNLDLSYFNSQKAYCYYIEFIGQIGDENNSFLKLNTKDAILFIYRKIIYNINQDIRKEFIISKDNSDMLMLVKNYCTQYNNIIFKIIDKCESTFQKNDDETLHYIIKSNTNLINKYISTRHELILIDKCVNLIDCLFKYDVDVVKIYILLEQYIKKYKKMMIEHNEKFIDELIQKNLLKLDINKALLTNKLITKLFYQ